MFAQLMRLKTLSPANLQRRLQESEVVTIIDVNSRDSWMKTRVPSATRLDPANFVDSDLPADKKAALVFYCSNPMCRKAPSAARRASIMGYGNVFVMPAGISGWLAAKLPVESAES